MSCYSCTSHHEMNVVNTRTSILYIHGCYTRTNHRKMPAVNSWAVTHVSHISWKHSSLKRHHQSKPKFRCQGSSEDPCMVAWGHATPWVGERCWVSKISLFHPLYLPYSLHFIVPLTFYHTISIHICGFYIIIFHFIHFSIKK